MTRCTARPSGSVSPLIVLRKYPSGRVMDPGRRRIAVAKRGNRWMTRVGMSVRAVRIQGLCRRAQTGALRNSTECGFAGFGDYAAWRR
jgi:hypothetical protein